MYLLRALFWEVDRHTVAYVHFSKENIYCEIVKKNCWKSHNWKWKSFYKIKIVGVSCLCLHVYLWDEKNIQLVKKYRVRKSFWFKHLINVDYSLGYSKTILPFRSEKKCEVKIKSFDGIWFKPVALRMMAKNDQTCKKVNESSRLSAELQNANNRN